MQVAAQVEMASPIVKADGFPNRSAGIVLVDQDGGLHEKVVILSIEVFGYLHHQWQRDPIPGAVATPTRSCSPASRLLQAGRQVRPRRQDHSPLRPGQQASPWQQRTWR